LKYDCEANQKIVVLLVVVKKVFEKNGKIEKRELLKKQNTIGPGWEFSLTYQRSTVLSVCFSSYVTRK
jgi:hypothetical protein